MARLTRSPSSIRELRDSSPKIHAPLAHTSHSSDEALANEPCPFFALGICRMPKKCNFSHRKMLVPKGKSQAAAARQAAPIPPSSQSSTRFVTSTPAVKASQPAVKPFRYDTPSPAITGSTAATSPVNASNGTSRAASSPVTISSPAAVSQDGKNFSGRFAPSSQRPPKPTSPDDPSNEMVELLKKWKFGIPLPRDLRRSRPLGDRDLAHFFVDALRLVQASSDTMQTVLTKLSEETGLVRVRELLRRKLEDLTDDALVCVWRDLFAPYFNILADERVLGCTVVEVRHSALLHELYGPSGTQGASIFSSVARLVAIPGHDGYAKVTIAVLAALLERVSSAKLHSDLQTSAEVLISCIDITKASRATIRSLRTIHAAFGIAAGIPEAPMGPQDTSNLVRPTFTVAQDLPGDLSSDGPRHDNDFHDIRDIQLLPTHAEIVGSRPEYLPREDPSEWHIPGLAGLIDRHFRLVREDTVGQLRDAAKFQLERLQKMEQTAHSVRQGARTNVYYDVKLQHVGFDDVKGVLFVLSFDQPANLQNQSLSYRSQWWQDSMRLNQDSLICLLSSDGSATFLVVHALNPFLPTGRPSPSAKLAKEFTLARDPLRANVIAQMTSTDVQDTTELLQSLTSANGVQRVIIEFPGVLLPAFGPTLTALQNMADTLDVPFAGAIVPGEPEKGLMPPAYSLRPGFRYSLDSLMPEDESVNVDPADKEQLESALQRSPLDEAQQKAVAHALTHALALIQGPPGTGKSYTGVKLIQTLLDNKDAAEMGPIICVLVRW